MDYGHTLLLDESWDISLDSKGRIITCTAEKAIAQNVANIIRLFTNDAYFDSERGIPHFVVDLGLKLNPAIIRGRFKRAAESVPGVAAANVTDIRQDEKRVLSCTIMLYTLNGKEVQVDIV